VRARPRPGRSKVTRSRRANAAPAPADPHLSSSGKTIPFLFASLRRDWYVSNDALSRAVRQAVHGQKRYRFVGFPRQWIPLFEWFGLKWSDSIPPLDYVPLFSDANENDILRLVASARDNHSLRLLAESTSALDPVVSDLLYIVDHSTCSADLVQREASEIAEAVRLRKRRLYLTSWQSYGRPSVRALEREAMRIRPTACAAVALPCSLARPYGRSKTHKRFYDALKAHGHDVSKMHRVVMTGLGVLPEELWSAPEVLAYDTGVPDIYRLLRVSRDYFRQAKYMTVIDCLQFKPYNDILAILRREGVIRRLQRFEP
jgi:Domain of unknown function (DUF5591)